MYPRYVDSHVLVADKPAGYLTQSAADPNLQDVLKAWVKERYKKPGNVFLEPIHRLDRPVSGLVIFARTTKALSRLQAALRAGQVKKIYRAEVEGKLPAAEGVLEHFLFHGEHRAVVVLANDPRAKRARLHYQVVAPGVIEIELETGRYHQIRAQLGAIGCPIVGDSKYGAMVQRQQIALSHERCEFPHPTQPERIVVTRS